MRDLEWLKKNLKKSLYPNNLNGKSWQDIEDAFVDLIDQVEQPSLPVIPDFVADELENNKASGQKIYSFMSTALNRVNHIPEWKDWAKVNEDWANIIARAWLDGYTIAEEQYVVKTSIGTYLVIDKRNRQWDYTEVPTDESSIKYATRFKREDAEAIAILMNHEVEITYKENEK